MTDGRPYVSVDEPIFIKSQEINALLFENNSILGPGSGGLKIFITEEQKQQILTEETSKNLRKYDSENCIILEIAYIFSQIMTLDSCQIQAI